MPCFQQSTRACGTISSSRHMLQIGGAAISTVLSKPASGGKPGDKPASGGKPGDTGGHSVREAIVFGLADLFFDFGQAYSAAELYQFYTQLRVFAYRRANTRPKSRMAHWKRS